MFQHEKYMSTVAQIRQYWRSSQADANLSSWQQFVEMSLLYCLRGIGPGYYVQSRWGRRSVAFRDKWAHMNRSEYRAFVSRWNPPTYQKASQHKLIEKATLVLQNFATPRFIGYAHKLRGRDANGNPVQDAAQLNELLERQVGKRLCFKLAEGFGGFGFQSYRIEQSASGARMCSPTNDAGIVAAQWWEEYGSDTDGFVIEEYMVQHPSMAAINPTSVNTVRLWVVATEQFCEVVGGHLRIGRNASQVDNIASGGLVGSAQRGH
jgi:Sugar-transfer associated ATP-grasp